MRMDSEHTSRTMRLLSSPWAEFADRATGRERVVGAFQPSFARWRATLPGPPYLQIVPEDLHG